MVSIVKLQPLQGNTYSVDYNKTDFKIQSAPNSLLAIDKSYILMSVSVPQPAPYQYTNIVLGRSSLPYTPSAFVRHMRLESATKGVINELNYLNVFMANTINNLALDIDELRSTYPYMGCGPFAGGYNDADDTTLLDAGASVVMKLPLSHVLPLARSWKYLPMDKYGRELMLSLELENQLKLFSSLTNTNNFALTVATCANIGAAPTTTLTLAVPAALSTAQLPVGARLLVKWTSGGQNFTREDWVATRPDNSTLTLYTGVNLQANSTSVSISYYDTALKVVSASGIVDNTNPINSFTVYSAANPNLSVGDTVIVRYSVRAAGAGANTTASYTLQTVITALGAYAANAQQITVQNPLTPAGQAVLGVSVCVLKNIPLDWQINKMDLVATMIQGNESTIRSLMADQPAQCFTVSVEPSISVETPVYQKLYTIEPQCVSILTCAIGERRAGEGDTLYSSFTNRGVNSASVKQQIQYRASLNNHELTSKPVILTSDLQMSAQFADRLINYCQNTNLPMHSVNPFKLSISEPITVIAERLTAVEEPVKTGPKQLDLRIEGANAMSIKNYYLFKEKYVDV